MNKKAKGGAALWCVSPSVTMIAPPSRTTAAWRRFPFKEILFIERDRKSASITAADGTAKVRKSLQQVYEELAAEEFIFIDQGCIANIIHIMHIKEGTVILKSDGGYAPRWAGNVGQIR
jgi:DNA-binding LytR/AlgR family response regulator